MALSLPADIPQRALLQEITFGVVLFTLLVQGTTIGWVVDRTIGTTATDHARLASRRPRGADRRGAGLAHYLRRNNPRRSVSPASADLRRPLLRRISSISWR